jgi:hypothetical protein
MFRNKPSNVDFRRESADGQLKRDNPVLTTAPELIHRTCWYGRRTDTIPVDLARHTTIEDGELLFCAHPMWFPVVGYQFDIRNCARCEYFRSRRA